jgi:hypothetical protein
VVRWQQSLEIFLKLQQLHEVRKLKHNGKAGLIAGALIELDSNTKLPKAINDQDELVDLAIKMMNEPPDGRTTQAKTAAAYPLSQVNQALSKLVKSDACGQLYSGLTKLADWHFLPTDNLEIYRRAAGQLANTEGLLAYVTELQMFIGAIHELDVVARNATDTYRKSISRAVLKKIGYYNEAD